MIKSELLWLDSSEDLPKINQRVFVLDTDGDVFMAYRGSGFQVYEDGETDPEGYRTEENESKKIVDHIADFWPLDNSSCFFTKQGADLIESLGGNYGEWPAITHWAKVTKPLKKGGKK